MSHEEALERHFSRPETPTFGSLRGLIKDYLENRFYWDLNQERVNFINLQAAIATSRSAVRRGGPNHSDLVAYPLPGFEPHQIGNSLILEKRPNGLEEWLQGDIQHEKLETYSREELFLQAVSFNPRTPDEIAEQLVDHYSRSFDESNLPQLPAAG